MFGEYCWRDQILDHWCFGEAQNVTKGEIKDAYPIMSNDSYFSCQTSIEDLYLKNGIDILWLIQEGDKVFYVSPTNWQGGVESTTGYELEWNSQWKSKNGLKNYWIWTLISKSFPIKCFSCGIETITYRHGFFISIRFILMTLPNTYQWMQ